MMSYFIEMDGYQTYDGAAQPVHYQKGTNQGYIRQKREDTSCGVDTVSEASSRGTLHYAYNSNSGGGQAFLAGTFSKGQSAIDLDGKNAHFQLRFETDDGTVQYVDLGNSSLQTYFLKPRSTGNTNIKISLETDSTDPGAPKAKIRPSMLLSSALMLPETCTINHAANIELSPLSKKNYWLRSMWLDCMVNGDEVTFYPVDFIFEGGVGKKDKNDKSVSGQPRYYKLDYEKRIRDIIQASQSVDLLPEDTANAISYFASIYQNIDEYEFDKANRHIAAMMKELTFYCPDEYSGLGDPLPLIMQLIHLDENSNNQSSVQTLPAGISHNLIYFGAPGTGKSFSMQSEANRYFRPENVTRVTFYPDYTNAQFVGSLRPYTEDGKSGYRYVPGPFLEVYLKALHSQDPVVLLIEEINRANPAAVFGDIFQLLDRADDGTSVFPINTSQELCSFLTNAKAVEAASLSIPPNMYIWATMNSADQGVFPMDTAFKRRWDFNYMGLDDGEAEFDGIEVSLGSTNKHVPWNVLRHAINNLLLSANVNEDKLLGAFFIPKSRLIDNDTFHHAFKNKVIMYLYEDAARMKRDRIFNPRLFDHESEFTYSKICNKFDEIGEKIFKDMNLPDFENSDSDMQIPEGM